MKENLTHLLIEPLMYKDYISLDNRYVFNHIFSRESFAKPLIEALLGQTIVNLEIGSREVFLRDVFPYTVQNMFWIAETSEGECHYVSLQLVDKRIKDLQDMVQFYSDFHREGAAGEAMHHLKMEYWKNDKIRSDDFIFTPGNPFSDTDSSLLVDTPYVYGKKLILHTDDIPTKECPFDLNQGKHTVTEKCINLNAKEELPHNALGDIVTLIRLGTAIRDEAVLDSLSDDAKDVVRYLELGCNGDRFLDIVHESYRDEKLYEYMQKAVQKQ